MKSVKPGRGPSFMGGVSSIGAAAFGVVWMLVALSSGAGVLFALFGVIFIGMAVGQAIYNFRNATGENRYSVVDITDGSEEPDPLNELFSDTSETDEPDSGKANFCPYCGTPAEDGYVFCRNCGKKL